MNFRDVTMRYRPDLPAAIKNVSVKVPGGKHVGIVGRTGAGKTSFIVVLFRLVDAAYRDHRAGWSRSALFVVFMQYDARFRSSRKRLCSYRAMWRTGLDPFGVHGEQTLRGVMGVGLPVQQFSKPADDLSVGQQQLLALGRLLLRTGSDRRRSS